jgi:predicted ArsR family transcriptional regulator
MVHHGAVAAAPQVPRAWTLLTNHGRVLLLIAQEPDLRLRDIADRAGITERSAQGIVRDLEEAGYVERERIGRRNSYRLHPEKPFRHPAESGHTVGELLDLFAGKQRRPSA